MIVDLRDYLTTPGDRDALVERCEALYFPEQERLGATFLGVFRDALRPQGYVFLRAMPDLPTRQRVMTEFYTDGAMWKAHRDQVNAWLEDSDDVLLLRPASELAPPARGPSEVGMYTYVQRSPLAPAEEAALRAELEAAVGSAGGRMLVTFRTDPAENNYPRHPIREGEHGLVWLATFGGRAARVKVAGVQQRRLLPTERSRLR